MRIAKRSRGNEGFFAIEQAGDAVDLGGLNRFIHRERRDYGRDTFGQHRFARSRWADHQDIMSTGDSYFDCAFDMALAFHIAEIDVITLVRSEKLAQISACGQKRDFAAQKRERLPQILHTVDIDLVDHRSLERVRFRYEQRALAPATRLKCDRQHAFYRADRTVECQFPNETKIFKWRTVEFFGYCDHPQRNR